MKIQIGKRTAIVAPSADVSRGFDVVAFESTGFTETVACSDGVAVIALFWTSEGISSQGLSSDVFALVPEIMIDETFALNISPSEMQFITLIKALVNNEGSFSNSINNDRTVHFIHLHQEQNSTFSLEMTKDSDCFYIYWLHHKICSE